MTRIAPRLTNIMAVVAQLAELDKQIKDDVNVTSQEYSGLALTLVYIFQVLGRYGYTTRNIGWPIHIDILKGLIHRYYVSMQNIGPYILDNELPEDLLLVEISTYLKRTLSGFHEPVITSAHLHTLVRDHLRRVSADELAVMVKSLLVNDNTGQYNPSADKE